REGVAIEVGGGDPAHVLDAERGRRAVAERGGVEDQRDLVVGVDGQALAELVADRGVDADALEQLAAEGGGRVFVTAKTTPECVEIEVEDDGRGIPEEERQSIFDRGARLDTGKPGTGLGLAIVRDVAVIYGGSISLEESEDLGGLLARLKLPLCH
ncbi:MAG: ATP-binding protein, partial [Allosphingosinicella sp.]